MSGLEKDSVSEAAVPACVHFGTCGGCQLQDVAYAQQLQGKAETLRRLFAAREIGSLPPIEVEAATPYGYRNRIRLRIEPGLPGSSSPFAVGYSRAGTNDFLPITMCPIAAPLLWRAAEHLLRLASTDPHVRRWMSLLSEIELFCNGEESRLQLQMFVRTPEGARHEAASFAPLCQRLQAEVPELSGASALVHPDLSRRERRLWDGVSWGAEGITYQAAGRSYWVPRGAFFQVNRFLVDRLVTLVTNGRSGELAWDLYAGVGLFTRAIAGSFRSVIAVEGAQPAARALQAIKPAPGAGAITGVHSPILEFLQAHRLQRERPELIICDPPRAGLGSEGAALLEQVGAAAICYVSCDPSTLAQDLVRLTRSYAVERLILIDLFPQTSHIETVVLLRHAGAEKR